MQRSHSLILMEFFEEELRRKHARLFPVPRGIPVLSASLPDLDQATESENDELRDNTEEHNSPAYREKTTETPGTSDENELGPRNASTTVDAGHSTTFSDAEQKSSLTAVVAELAPVIAIKGPNVAPQIEVGMAPEIDYDGLSTTNSTVDSASPRTLSLTSSVGDRLSDSVPTGKIGDNFVNFEDMDSDYENHSDELYWFDKGKGPAAGQF